MNTNMSAFIDNVLIGANNPDCSLYVGYTIGTISTWMFVGKIFLYYFALRLLERMLFEGIPRLYKFIRKRLKGKEKNNENN